MLPSRGARRAGCPGFTIVELSIALAIVGVLGALALVAFARSGRKTATDGFARIVSTMAQQARLTATVESRFVRVIVNGATAKMQKTTTTGMSATVFAPTGTTALARAGVLVAAVTATPDLASTSPASTFAGSPITWRPDGSSTGGTVYVSDSAGDNKWKLVVYPSTGFSRLIEGW